MLHDRNALNENRTATSMFLLGTGNKSKRSIVGHVSNFVAGYLSPNRKHCT